MHLKLALYSDQVIPGNAPIDLRLLSLIGNDRPRIGYVASSPDPERLWFEEKRSYYARFGAHLAPYVDESSPSLAIEDLLACDAIHLSGGNTFHFLSWIRKRGLSELLPRYVHSGGVLVGTSAGAILMTPDIATAEHCGDQNLDGLTDFSALNLVDFDFLPHFAGADFTPRRKTYACPDGAGIIVGSELELFGNVRTLEP
ncbi:MAG TPA: Type 1 glutamine amidotransferase-like domain-containing protein [Fimbriimonas sp.]|nr:Type 1 glutamine amidotransferase-like domain-containing protein [Fimbriimonas sp.]